MSLPGKYTFGFDQAWELQSQKPWLYMITTYRIKMRRKRAFVSI